MDLEQYLAQEWKSVSTAPTGSESLSGCFDCNICFDFAHEPVVTLCGHLYCWPCIYKWLHVQSASLALDEHPRCPVCKADICHTTMVPLYGRGQGPAEAEAEAKAKALYRDITIPPRPSASDTQALMSSTPSPTGQRLPYRNPYRNHNFDANPYSGFEGPAPAPVLNVGTAAMTGLHHPVVGMFGEMVYASVFGNSENLYAYPNSYQLVRSSSPRLRRHEMQADKSLNRISFFLFCCFLLCLIVF